MSHTDIATDITKTARDRRALIVLGMHRSGTSALTGALGLLGADLPRDLMAAAEMNAKGFFESNIITNLNEELLIAAGMSWWDPRRFPVDWFGGDQARAFDTRAQSSLRDEYGDSDLFVMKDPRICRLLPFWLPVLRNAGCQPLIVHTHRAPQEVAASLGRWANYDSDYALLLWLRHVLDAEAETRGELRCFVTYDALMTDWRTTISGISTALGIDWPRNPDQAASDVDAFLSKDLQHFSQKIAPNSADLPDWLQTVLDILDRWSKTGEQAEDYLTLDALRRDLDRSSNFFLPMAQKTQALTNETRYLRQLSIGLQARLDETPQEVGDSPKSQSKIRNELHQAQSALLQRGQETEDLYRQLDKLKATLAQSEEEAINARLIRQDLTQKLQLNSDKLQQMTWQAATRMRRDLAGRLSRISSGGKPRLLTAREQELQDQLDLVGRDSARLQENLNSREAENRDLARLVALAQDQAAAANAGVSKLEARIAAIHNSTSWRFTKSMRQVTAILKRLRPR